MAEIETYDLICAECGAPVRLSRVSNNTIGDLAYYVDEQGSEQVEYPFHFHDIT